MKPGPLPAYKGLVIDNIEIRGAYLLNWRWYFDSKSKIYKNYKKQDTVRWSLVEVDLILESGSRDSRIFGA